MTARKQASYGFAGLFVVLTAVITLLVSYRPPPPSEEGPSAVTVIRAPASNEPSANIRLRNMQVPRADDQPAFRHLPTGNDALLDGFLDDVGTADNPGNPLSMYRKVRSEGRDSQWAAKTEEILGKQISQVPYLDPKRPTRVICGTTICEVAGVISADASIPNMNVAMAQLQSTTMLEFADKNGFDPDRMSIVFGIARGNPDGNAFVRYFVRRTPGEDPGRSGQARDGGE